MILRSNIYFKAKILGLILGILIVHNGASQTQVTTSLYDLIKAAQTKSTSALLAKTKLENQYWRNVSFTSLFKPQLNIQGIIPSLNRTISSIALPDGQEAFVNRSFVNNSVGISLNQNILQTGGSVFVSSDINRLDILGSNSQKTYLFTPISIGINQPLFAFNELRWNKELVDLEYEIAQKTYTEDFEMVAIETSNLFFSLYLNTLRLEIARENQGYLDSLSRRDQKRYELGRISETQMLQVQLSARNADALVMELRQETQSLTERLRNYVGFDEKVTFNLLPPGQIPHYDIDQSLALQNAQTNRSTVLQFQRRLKEAEGEIKKAEANNRPTVDLSATFGLNRSSTELSDIFSPLQDQESVRLSFNIPIADWGRLKAQREIAQSSYELENIRVQQEKINLVQEILVTIDQLILVRQQVSLAEKAVEIAEKRENIAKNRYQIGKLNATDLNIAIQEKAQSIQSYYTALWNSWQLHFRLRLLTLYDFENGRIIDADTKNQ